MKDSELRKMAKELTSQTEKAAVQKQDKADRFEIKNPRWALWFCTVVAAGFFIAFCILLNLTMRHKIPFENIYLGYIALGVSLIGAVGVWICAYERLAYADGAYTYRPPFGKASVARVEDIKKVKILKIYTLGKCGIHKKIRVIFYDKNKNVLIKIIDDGTIDKSEVFEKSLKVNHIKLARVEEHRY